MYIILCLWMLSLPRHAALPGLLCCCTREACGPMLLAASFLFLLMHYGVGARCGLSRSVHGCVARAHSPHDLLDKNP